MGFTVRPRSVGLSAPGQPHSKITRNALIWKMMVGLGAEVASDLEAMLTRYSGDESKRPSGGYSGGGDGRYPSATGGPAEGPDHQGDHGSHQDVGESPGTDNRLFEQISGHHSPEAAPIVTAEAL